MTVTHKTGDLLQATEPAIAHGVNTCGVMGAGVAKAIRSMYPAEMFELYRMRCQRGFLLPGGVDMYDKARRLPILFNVASQEKPGADATIDLLAEGMLKALHTAKKIYGVAALAVPRIGCGIGGLTWEPVEAVLTTASLASGVDVVVYSVAPA